MSRIRLALLAPAAAALLLAACSTHHNNAAPPTSAPTATTHAASAPASASPAAATGLTGRWSGTYSGAYSGTFKLKWRQTGQKLKGTIRISNPGSSLPINGTLKGNKISFGTVGSIAITYSGTVSGASSMSGTYQVHGGSGAAGGPWSAVKTS